MPKKKSPAQRAAKIAKRHRLREDTIRSIKAGDDGYSAKELQWLFRYGELRR